MNGAFEQTVTVVSDLKISARDIHLMSLVRFSYRPVQELSSYGPSQRASEMATEFG